MRWFWSLTPATLAAGILLACPARAQLTDPTRADPPGQTGGAQLSIGAEVVRQVEEALRSSGYNVGRVDGIWDAQLQAALIRFQQARGLEPTGQLDDRTLSALGERAADASSGDAAGPSGPAGGGAGPSGMAEGRGAQDPQSEAQGRDTRTGQEPEQQQATREGDGAFNEAFQAE